MRTLIYFVNILTPSTFLHFLAEIVPDFLHSKFLAAVSGGVDSMVLMQLMASSGLSLEAAHVNYGLRGSDSDEDENLVRKFCSHHNIPLHIYRVSEADGKPEQSIQNWARELRYRFFGTIASENDLDYTVTAHHLNDQLETFLINLSKAAGLHGLTGIAKKRDNIIRPLLSFSKEEIYRYAAENKIDFREDASNDKTDYLRNKIRLEIVPRLMETNADFLQNFYKSLTYLDQAKNYSDKKIREAERFLMHREDEKVYIKKNAFIDLDAFEQFEILRKFGFDTQNEINKIMTAETGKIFFSKDFRLTVDLEFFVIEPKNGEQEEPKIIVFKDIATLQSFDFTKENHAQQKIWEFDADKLKFPLSLRNKKEGDYFYPTGLKGKKLVSKFLKDEKIPILARSKVWLLCDHEDSVLGVIPFRQDRRYVPDRQTENKIEIKF